MSCFNHAGGAGGGGPRNVYMEGRHSTNWATSLIFLLMSCHLTMDILGGKIKVKIKRLKVKTKQNQLEQQTNKQNKH